MKLYVVGFLHYKDEVVLLRKSRPPMLAGKLNGIGGKIEPGEHAVDAMVREFAEETGLQTSERGWLRDRVLHCGPIRGGQSPRGPQHHR